MNKTILNNYHNYQKLYRKIILKFTDFTYIVR